jgi:hypothetical protein
VVAVTLKKALHIDVAQRPLKNTGNPRGTGESNRTPLDSGQEPARLMRGDVITMANKDTKRPSGKTAAAKTLKEKRADKKDKADAKAKYKEV